MDKKKVFRLVKEAQNKEDEHKTLKDLELLALQVAAITGIVPGTHLINNRYYFIDFKKLSEYTIGVVIAVDDKFVYASDVGYSNTEIMALEYAAKQAGFAFDILDDILCHAN